MPFVDLSQCELWCRHHDKDLIVRIKVFTPKKMLCCGGAALFEPKAIILSSTSRMLRFRLSARIALRIGLSQVCNAEGINVRHNHNALLLLMT